MTAPLAGIRVLDLTRLLPGNYCTWLLAALGAEVIKVEDPGAGDYMRTIGHQVDGQSAAHHLVNRAKRSVVIDLKSEEGRAVFLELVATADAVVDSFRPGVMDRLGLGPDRLREDKPGLVVASISGFGAEGPGAGVVAHDLNATAFSGFLHQLVGPDDGLPPTITTPFGDIVGGGLVPALGVVALLLRSRASGEGGWLDSSLAEGFALLPSVVLADVLAGQPTPPPGTREFDGRGFYRVYRLADGMAAVAAVEPQFWKSTCQALDVEDLIDAQWDDMRQEEVIARLTERFAGLTKAELLQLVAGRDTCVSLVNSYDEMVASDHARERDLVRPSVDAPMQVLAPPFRIDGARPPETVGAPTQGQHTDEVLLEAGLSAERVAGLREAGVVGLRERS